MEEYNANNNYATGGIQGRFNKLKASKKPLIACLILLLIASLLFGLGVFFGQSFFMITDTEYAVLFIVFIIFFIILGVVMQVYALILSIVSLVLLAIKVGEFKEDKKKKILCIVELIYSILLILAIIGYVAYFIVMLFI